jgi:hypothetical protein
MKRPLHSWLALASLAAALTLVWVGCDYSAPASLDLPPLVESAPTPNPGSAAAAVSNNAASPKTSATSSTSATDAFRPGDLDEGPFILENVVNLIQTASLKPGGDNFGIATKNLNQYFKGRAQSSDYRMSPAAREYLLTQLPEPAVNTLEAPTWTIRDARHLEDFMLYHKIATRVGGAGDDLTRVRRVFDWIVRNVQLVPAGSLGAQGLGQAQARPYDVLLRGMATEEGGTWSERGWMFLAFCRQLGIDGGMVTYTPPGQKKPIVWLCAILIDKKAYLFDPRLGLAIPGLRGEGVATLDDALGDPIVLDRLALPGQHPYNTTRASLAASPSKIGILLDSSIGYISPRMQLLQRDLAGKNRTVLYRDPADQRDKFAEALGSRLGRVDLWELPLMVETFLFTNPKFVEATQRSLYLFGSRFPLLYARMKQLQGNTAEAVQDYVSFRFAERAVEMDRRTPLSAEVQLGLDVYSTYYLGLANIELNKPEQAAFFFREILRLLPEPAPRRPYLCMFRWGAQANLARLCEAKGDLRQAAAYYVQPDPTTQAHGNLLRARDLVWSDPFAPVPAPLPPAPHLNAPVPPSESKAK